MDNWEDNIITEDKVLEAIKTFKVKKSPGMDGIHPLVLQQLPRKLSHTLQTCTKCVFFLDTLQLDGKNVK